MRILTTLMLSLATFSAYHHQPVITRRGRELRVGDANLLFFYKNRLDGFGLERHIGDTEVDGPNEGST